MRKRTTIQLVVIGYLIGCLLYVSGCNTIKGGFQDAEWTLKKINSWVSDPDARDVPKN